MMADGHPVDLPLANVARALFAPLSDAVARQIPPGFVGAVLPGGDLVAGEFRGLDPKTSQVKVNSPFLGVQHFGLANKEIVAEVFHDVAPSTTADVFRIRTVDGSAYGTAILYPSLATR